MGTHLFGSPRTICIFLDAYNVRKHSNKNFAPVKKQTFR